MAETWTRKGNMLYATFTKEMKGLLRSMVGKTMKSYEGDFCGTKRVYGVCRIHLGRFSIELQNEVQGMPFFEGEEDIPVFTCRMIGENDPFWPETQGAETLSYMVDEKIREVDIATDVIRVNTDEYEITIDHALIIKTDRHCYSFYKDWMYGETINIVVTDSEPELYPIEKVKEEWSDQGEDRISVRRTVQPLEYL